jgi:hypothetical protein
MKRIFPKVFSVLVVLSLYGQVSFAQEESSGQLWFCWEATVNPARVNEFIDLQVEYRTHFKEANFSYPVSGWTDGMFHFYVFFAVDSYDEVNTIYSALGDVNEIWGADRLNRMWETVETHRTFFIRWIPELSYAPEHPRLADGEATFAVWDIMYIDPSKEAEFCQSAGKFTKMLKNAGFDDPLNFMIGDQGYEATAYLGVLYGKNQSDLWAQNEKLWSKLGEEGAQLNREVMGLLKKRDFKQFWYVKELSYDPEE